MARRPAQQETPPALYGTKPTNAPTVPGKYWGFRLTDWYPVKITGLPSPAGGTGRLVYAPIDRRGYPYEQSAALSDCQAVWGPVKTWGNKPPQVEKAALLAVGVSEFWLRRHPA